MRGGVVIGGGMCGAEMRRVAVVERGVGPSRAVEGIGMCGTEERSVGERCRFRRPGLD